MADSAFTVRVEGKILKLLDQLASKTDRSRNYLVNRAIGEFIEVHAWQDQKIKAGLRDADRGDFASDRRLKNILNKYDGR